MSILNKNWEIRNKDKTVDIHSKLLDNRGIKKQEDISVYLKPDMKRDSHDPFLMKGMDKAVKRIYKAIEKQEKIIIFGDYDVDGISGTAIVYNTLDRLGAKVSYRLPHRVKDGYGINDKFVPEFADLGVSVLITVDCGISNAEQISLAKEKGIDVIITDHHTIPENFPSDAYAILHPMQEDCSYPFKSLTGAGVALKFAQALLKEKGEDIIKDETFACSLIDLACLGTVADCGPLVDENRLIVQKGLQCLAHTSWYGLECLQKEAGIDPKKLSTFSIGYQIGPRINAPGRIDSPYFSLQLLLQKQNDQKGEKFAKKIEEINKKRQEMVATAMEDAEARYKKEGPENKIIIIEDPEWHVGILGLIAGRLAERNAKPAIILQDFGDYLVASARSIEGFNVIKAITKFGDLLDQFGGHAQAAGLKIKKENYKEFKEKLTKYTNKELKNANLKSTLFIDCEIKEKDLNWKTFDFIETMSPFGIENVKPAFLIKSAKVQNAIAVGKEKKHLKFFFEIGGKKMGAIGFNMGSHLDDVRRHRSLNLVCELEKNEWNNETNLELRIIDFELI